MQKTSGFSVFMYGQSGFTVDINFFTAKNVDTIEMCMFSEESSRKSTAGAFVSCHISTMSLRD